MYRCKHASKNKYRIRGKAGDNFGGLNHGSKIILNGDAGRFVGNGMKGGEIIINSNCDDGLLIQCQVEVL